MTKDKLQQELLKKIKPGIKPSELKNQKKGVLHDFNLPPSDEGYESDSETIRPKSSAKSTDKSKVKQLQTQVKFESQKAQNYLTELQSTLAELDQAQQEIQHLQSQPSQLSQETEQAIAEANQKIRQLIKANEELQSKNKELNKSIAELKNPAKTKEKVKEQKETKEQTTQTEPTFFYCDNCQQSKHGNYTIRRIDSPFEPRTHKKFCYICSDCRKYTKEYNEKADWKEEDNPYRIN